ncbi:MULTISPECIES: DUF7096 domain-containing protein [Halorussus]|uniref:DUF7096 domain-containing protein n=1 Tax=Halorussus TaxID=1070314 RepID=UPI00209D7A0F|nr:hypothetical protein [Halorussus vallis]USZ74326.1 hypothetical protein NGM07_12830 [Halorussus vallis]
MRLAPVMLALLLALSPGVVATHSAAPSASADVRAVDSNPPESTEPRFTLVPPTNASTTVLTLGKEPKRTAFDSPSLSLGDTLVSERSEVQSRLSTGALEERLRTARNDEQKKQILNRYRYRIENRIISLSARERQVTKAFTNGSMSADAYLRALGQIDREAQQLRTLIDAMQTSAQPIPRFRMKTEADTLKGKLVTLEGPVRNRIAEQLRGEAPPTRVFVATADTGVVLSAIVDGTYTREVTRIDRRNPGLQDHISLSEVPNIVERNYPWIRNNSDSTGTASYGATNVYRRWMTHENGRLVTYLDGGTRSIFDEIQYKRLSPSLSTGPAVTNTSENVTLSVNRTYPGGPLRVRLANETGAPLQGTISVAGERIGRTDSAGVLWTLGPASQFRVTATHEGTTVNATVRPTAPPRAPSGAES